MTRRPPEVKYGPTPSERRALNRIARAPLARSKVRHLRTYREKESRLPVLVHDVPGARVDAATFRRLLNKRLVNFGGPVYWGHAFPTPRGRRFVDGRS